MVQTLMMRTAWGTDCGWTKKARMADRLGDPAGRELFNLLARFCC